VALSPPEFPAPAISRAYQWIMEISFKPEVEATLRRMAEETGRGLEQVVVDLISTQLDYDEWFRHEVRKGIDALDRGESIPDEEVDTRLDQMLRAE
jgi:predicted transcriptional regulator